MTFSNKDIQDDIEFKSLIRAKNLKPGSIRLYIHRIRMYCDFNEMTPSELIKEAEDEQDEGKTKIRHRKVNIRLGDFVDNLKERDLAAETIRGYFASIKALYNFCEIETSKIALPALSKNKAFERLIEYEEIKTVVTSSNQRDKSIFLLHLSTGMSLSDVRLLKYKDFLKSLEAYTETSKYLSVEDLIDTLNKKDNIFPVWRGTRKKNDYPFLTFSSPESVREILLYLQKRINTRFEIKSEDDYLFAGLRSVGVIGERDYIAIFERANKKHKLGLKPNGYSRFTSHELRRYFTTSCMKAGVDILQRNFFIGHSIDKTDAAYQKVQVDILKQSYMKVLPYISFDKIRKINIEDPEVTEMRKELLESQKQNRELAEILQLREEFDKLPKPSEKSI